MMWSGSEVSVKNKNIFVKIKKFFLLLARITFGSTQGIHVVVSVFKITSKAKVTQFPNISYFTNIFWLYTISRCTDPI